VGRARPVKRSGPDTLGNRLVGSVSRQRVVAPTSLPASSSIEDELGKLVQQSVARLSQADSFAEFLEASRQPSDLHPDVRHLPHPASSLLEDLRTSGVKASFDTPDWTLQQRSDALKRGAHRSAMEHLEFVRDEFTDFAKKGYFLVLPVSSVLQENRLRLSPLGVVPQVGRRPRLICDLSFFGVNASSVSSAP
jgi:hypothetical protein